MCATWPRWRPARVASDLDCQRQGLEMRDPRRQPTTSTPGDESRRRARPSKGIPANPVWKFAMFRSNQQLGVLPAIIVLGGALTLGCVGRDRRAVDDLPAGDGGAPVGRDGGDPALPPPDGSVGSDDAGTEVPPRTCPEGPCDLLSGSGCGGSQACRYLSADGRTLEVMCEYADRTPEGVYCTDYTQCGPGVFCSDVSYACRQYCCGGSDDSCSPSTFCLDIWDGVGLCEPDARCDLTTSAGCEGGARCLLLRDDGATLCLDSSGTKDVGEPCSGLECGPGMQCLKLEGEESATCHQFCSLADPASCDVGNRCTSLEASRRPDLGTCETVENPCASSTATGACTNPADCAVYDGNPLAAVSAALECRGDAGCVSERTGLTAPCSACFANLGDRGTFLRCAGF